MNLPQLYLLVLFAFGVVPVASSARSTPGFGPFKRDVTSAASSSKTGPAPADSTMCGYIIDEVNKGNWYHWAIDAYECLTSVPFHPAVALRFLDYFNTTIQFQSSLAYLRNPPAGYQQPPIDVDQALQDIAANVSAGRYQNQYDFEADVMHLIYAMHDTHVYLHAGAMSAFTFGSGVSLVSASIDGVQPPKVYFLGDVINRKNNRDDIKAIGTINGENAIDWLKRFAAQNSIGTIEPHADWNQVMYRPVQDILQSYDIFNSGATFYPGNELAITLEDGSDTFEGNWLAVYTGTTFTGPLATGGDFYNFFVLGNFPENYKKLKLPKVFELDDDDNGEADGVSNLTSWHNATWGTYPDNPVVVQPGLATGGFGGVVTGYLLKDISTGVLSIPSFDAAGYNIEDFATAVDKFINITQRNKVKRVIIDMQGNLGGQPLLAFATFGSFFPNIMPFAGSRRRSHHLANVVGNATTTFWSNLPPKHENKTLLEGDEWIVTDRINAETGRNFSSWSQYYGPKTENGDYFSLVEQYDFSNINFQSAIFDNWYSNQYVYGVNKSAIPAFEPDEIVILTDGQCASTCTLFLEMMTHQAGVRTIVVGGFPDTGPMQAGAGTRGAALYTDDQIDDDFATANNYSDDATVSQLPHLNPETSMRDTGMVVSYFGINLRDQVRNPKGSSAVPLQFSYLAADCRIYFTLDNILNMTRLWHDVVDAMWLDTSRCVANSTGYSEASSDVVLPPPDRPENNLDFPSASNSASKSVSSSDPDSDLDNDLWNGFNKQPRAAVRLCDEKDTCDPPFRCVKAWYPCSNGNAENTTRRICVPMCDAIEKTCPLHHMECDISHAASAEQRTKKLNENRHSRPNPKNNKLGRCIPTYGSQFENIGCSKQDATDVTGLDGVGS